MTPAASSARGRLPSVPTPDEAVWRTYLIRHAETEWSLSGRHTGKTDVPLTEKGRRIARELESLLAPSNFALVLSSPLQRARQTSALAGFGERAVIDRDLLEWDYGAYEGLTTEQIHERAPDWMIFSDGCPDGESPAQIGARVDRVIARVQSTAGDVALFAHGHLLRVLAARWLGLPVSDGSRFLLDTATLSVLSHYRSIPAIKQWNSRVPDPGNTRAVA
jgi:broad specificity phosphatase PhoE